ncbi:hypothetical protein BHE74_00026709 [Ensete ventricosum]|nr:hypothetical protein BHE74_00026709 [Ensete ventricosum]
MLLRLRYREDETLSHFLTQFTNEIQRIQDAHPLLVACHCPRDVLDGQLICGYKGHDLRSVRGAPQEATLRTSPGIDLGFPMKETRPTQDGTPEAQTDPP